MKHCLLIICLFCTLSIFSQDSPIIPQPAELKMGQGSFIVNNKTAIVTKGGLR